MYVAIILTLYSGIVEICMDEGETVSYINNQGDISEEECEVIEDLGDFLRIKKPSGETIRIFRDRVCKANSKDRSSESKQEKQTMKSEEFNPWNGLPSGHEIWSKSPSFSDTVICKIYAIIDPKGSNYKSVNTYDGVAHKIMTYPMKSYDALINKLLKRGYEKETRR